MTKNIRRLVTRSPKPRANLNLPPMSLLWPGRVPELTAPAPGWATDLGLEEVVEAIAIDRFHRPFIHKTLSALHTDTPVIAWRQAVMGDFIRNANLVDGVQRTLPRLSDLRQGTALLGKRQRNLLLDTADRLSELETYVNVVQDLHDTLTQCSLESSALNQLRDHLMTLLADEQFQALRRDLPAMRAPLENIRSLTIGINLDVELKPYSAVLLAIHDSQIGEQASLLERLIGIRTDENEESGIARLHYTPKDTNQRPLSPLFQDLDRILTDVAQPVAKALNRYARIASAGMANLEHELAFYAGAALVIQRAREQGIAFCAPAIADLSERCIEIDGLSHIGLALKEPERPIPSDATFNNEGRIAVLTGPNNGGKTTYLRAVGLAQVMFQAGLFIPAERARISPTDKILTHFPALENRQQGRLAEEAIRLHSLFKQITPYSLVLLNETFSSTSSNEAQYLARDILCGLRAVGVRAIYATHLTELAEHLAEIEASIDGESNLFSLVAGVHLTIGGDTRPTYEIKHGKPLGRSYAQEIARRYGISLEQILQMRTPPKAAPESVEPHH